MQKNVIDLVKKFENKSDGTYDIHTLAQVEYSVGYQVSFVRPEAFEQLGNKDWDIITNYLSIYLESPPYIGVYDGKAEISFHSLSREKAIETMVTYNQESILDWQQKKKFPNDMEKWFIVNRNYNKEGEVDYGEILKTLL